MPVVLCAYKRAIMIRVLALLLRIGAICLVAFPAALPATDQAGSTGEAMTPSGAVGKVCTACHGLQLVLDTPRNYDSWHDTVQAMIDRGATGTPEEFNLVMEFLSQNMTTVDVNRADSDMLEATLRASPAAVTVLMEKRKDHPFKDLADLLNRVPGLDKDILEGKKQLIFFH